MDNLSFEAELLEALDQEQKINADIMFYMQLLIENWRANATIGSTCIHQLNALFIGDFETLEKELKNYPYEAVSQGLV